MKTYKIVLLILFILTFSLGSYAAFHNWGYLALLMGLFAGKISSSFFRKDEEEEETVKS